MNSCKRNFFDMFKHTLLYESNIQTRSLAPVILTPNYLCVCCSTWVIMNRETRRLSKIPDEVKKEVQPFYLDRMSIPTVDSDGEKIDKLTDETADRIRSGLAVSIIIHNLSSSIPDSVILCFINCFSSVGKQFSQDGVIWTPTSMWTMSNTLDGFWRYVHLKNQTP